MVGFRIPLLGINHWTLVFVISYRIRAKSESILKSSSSTIHTYQNSPFSMAKDGTRRKLQLTIANSWLNHPYLDSQQQHQHHTTNLNAIHCACLRFFSALVLLLLGGEFVLCRITITIKFRIENQLLLVVVVVKKNGV